MLSKRERLERTVAGESVDRTPAALWRHWPGDDQRAADLAHAVIQFQRTYDWDFVRVMPASTYCVADYGVKDDWHGALSGDRICVKPAVKRSLEWTELRTLDPRRGEMGKQLDAFRMIAQELKGDQVPVIATIYSPLAQAQRIADSDLLTRNLRTHADRLRTGLNVITESILRFIDALKPTDIAGVCYVVEHADYAVLSEEEYRSFGLPFDRKIIEMLPQKWWLNMLHLRGRAPMLSVMGGIGVQAVSWNDAEGRPDLARGKALVSGAVCGGLSAHQAQTFTPAALRDAARSAIQTMAGRRLILSVSDAVPVTTPLSNLRAVRDVIETVGNR